MKIMTFTIGGSKLLNGDLLSDPPQLPMSILILGDKCVSSIERVLVTYTHETKFLLAIECFRSISPLIGCISHKTSNSTLLPFTEIVYDFLDTISNTSNMTYIF